MRLSRAECLTATLAAVALPLWPGGARAFDLETAIAVAPVYQLSAAVEDIDGLLFDGLLEQRPPLGVPAADGATVRGLVRTLVREGQLRAISRNAASVAVDARVLARRQVGEVEAHAKEAEERLVRLPPSRPREVHATDGSSGWCN
jgi:hypothetical protein